MCLCSVNFPFHLFPIKRIGIFLLSKIYSLFRWKMICIKNAIKTFFFFQKKIRNNILYLYIVNFLDGCRFVLMVAWEIFFSTCLLPGKIHWIAHFGKFTFHISFMQIFCPLFIYAQRLQQQRQEELMFEKLKIPNTWYVHIVPTTWSKKVNLNTYVLFSFSFFFFFNFWQGSLANAFKIVS